MTPQESRNSTPARPEHLNADEAEEKDLKNNFMKTLETLKYEKRKFLKGIEKKQTKIQEMQRKMNQKIEEIRKIP